MTTIEWTDASWNMIRARNLATGGVGHFCVKIDPACAECYAELYQPRRNNPIRYAAQDLKLVEPFLDDVVLRQPLGWRARRMIFPCSMTDLFAEFHPDRWIDQVFAIAALTPRHTYQCLTKRADRLHKYMTLWPDGSARVNHVFAAILSVLGHNDAQGPARDAIVKRAQDAVKVWPLPNWWQGVSAGTQKGLAERVPLLFKTPAALRWLSAEPLLERLDLRSIADGAGGFYDAVYREGPGHFDGQSRRIEDVRLDWVVVGGESGPRARECNLAWIEDLVAQCRPDHEFAGVPTFVKQLGAKPVVDGSQFVIKLKSAKGGDETEWPGRFRVREMPRAG